jgi:hypothetical protein
MDIQWPTTPPFNCDELYCDNYYYFTKTLFFTLRWFVRLRIELRLVIRRLHRNSACFYVKKSGKCNIEFVQKIVST